MRRVLKGITSHFATRVPEWFTAYLITHLGVTLLFPPPQFPQSQAWAVVASWWPEERWGLVMVGVGTVHLAALVVNGTFRRFRWSPHLRGFASLLACFVWLQLVLGLWLAPVISTGLINYRAVLFLELWNVWNAFSDAGRSDRRHAPDVS